MFIRSPLSVRSPRVLALPTFFRWLTKRRSSRRNVPPDQSPAMVKHALANLDSPSLLEINSLIELPVMSTRRSTFELRALLVDVVGDLCEARNPRDAEAGRVLHNYYVKRVGTHEVNMERLNLSRPTYFRRLRRGHFLVANELSRLSDFAVRLPA